MTILRNTQASALKLEKQSSGFHLHFLSLVSVREFANQTVDRPL